MRWNQSFKNAFANRVSVGDGGIWGSAHFLSDSLGWAEDQGRQISLTHWAADIIVTGGMEALPRGGETRVGRRPARLQVPSLTTGTAASRQGTARGVARQSPALSSAGSDREDGEER